jgi:hypothetical protein
VFGKRVGVCALGGAVVAVARIYEQTDSFKDLPRRLGVSARDFGRQWGTTVDVSPVQCIAVVASVGGVFGAGFPVVSKATGRAGIVAGGSYGVAAWGTVELLFRTAPGRTRRWAADPRQWVPGMAAYGALVALIDSYAA